MAAAESYCTMKIIVLGATGQIGSVIYNGLRQRHEVVGTSRNHNSDLAQFDPFHDDWSILGKADVLINCVGQIEARESSFHHVHVELTKRIIENRDVIRAGKIIQISALGASAHHPVVFLRTKGIADDLLQKQTGTVVIRPSIVCTHRTMIVKKMLLLSSIGRSLFGVVPIPKGFLKTKIQPVMPQDLLDLVEKMFHDTTHQIVNAVGPEPITFEEIIKIMAKARNQRLRLVGVPKAFTDVIVKSFIGTVLPKIINSQQYQLLFEDNIDDVKVAEEILRRPMISTWEFFINEFVYAGN